ncbi:MAG: flagellar filament capping protein FliD [Massilia sp.]
MGLSSAGIGSNLDVEGIVTKLMSVEQQPLALLQKKETSYQAKLSGFGTLKGALSAFQTAVKGLSDISKFQATKGSVADPLVAGVTANASATPGNYSLKVTQLAQAQKLVAAGTVSQVAPVGSGVISIDFGTVSGGTFDSTTGKYTGAAFTSAGNGIKTLTIDASNNSLSGIRDAINKADLGVTASIVNDGGSSPYRLTLTSNATGKANSMKISVADTAPDTALSALLNNDPAGTQGLSQTATAQNAELTIDGIAVSKASNTVNDVITGVTLNLLKENPTTATAVSVTRDTAAVTTSVNAFVKAYNDISQNLRDAAAYNPTTKVAAVLNGEATVRTIQSQVRGLMTASIAGGAGAFSRLSEIGVALDKDGLLAVDSTKLNKAMTSNFDDLASLFATTGKATDSTVAYSSSSTKTVPGSYDVTVTQAATKGATLATAPAGLTIDATNNTMSVMLNGVNANITLTQKTYASAAELASELQSKINGVTAFGTAGSAVTVTESGGILNVQSNRYGSNSGINITESGPSNLHFATSGPNVTAGLDVTGTINGVSAVGNGQLLVGATGDPSEGLAVIINGSTLGAHGKINYSQGYAAQFDKMVTGLLGTGGALASRTDGLNASIKALNKSEADLTARLAVTEKRYRAQFTALDLTVSKMNSTSTFLTQQLAQISSLTAG